MIMRKKSVLLTLVSCLLWMTTLPNLVAAQGNTQAASTDIEDIKKRVAASRAEPDARFEVLLKDGRRIAGRLGEITEDGFTVTGRKSGASETVAYQEVAAVRKKPCAVLVKFGVIALIADTSALAIT